MDAERTPTAATPTRIGEHLFDPRTGELTGPAGRTRLRPQQAALLSLLAARAGELVTHDELRAHLRPGTAVEPDRGLNHDLRQLRVALGDSAEAPRYIETLPERGYRLVAPVAPAPPAEPPAQVARPAPGEAPTAGAQAPAARGGAAPLSRRAVVLGAATAAAGLAAWVSAAVRPGRPPAARLPLVAVLALDAPPGSAERRAGQALAEALTAELTRGGASRVGVIGPATTRRYDGTATPVERIRAELGVAHVLSGTVRREGDSLRVFARLIRTSDLRRVWAQRYTVPAAADATALARRMGAELLSALSRP